MWHFWGVASTRVKLELNSKFEVQPSSSRVQLDFNSQSNYRCHIQTLSSTASRPASYVFPKRQSCFKQDLYQWCPEVTAQQTPPLTGCDHSAAANSQANAPSPSYTPFDSLSTKYCSKSSEDERETLCACPEVTAQHETLPSVSRRSGNCNSKIFASPPPYTPFDASPSHNSPTSAEDQRNTPSSCPEVTAQPAPLLTGSQHSASNNPRAFPSPPAYTPYDASHHQSGTMRPYSSNLSARPTALCADSQLYSLFLSSCSL